MKYHRFSVIFRQNWYFLFFAILIFIGDMPFTFAQDVNKETQLQEEQSRYWANRIREGGQKNSFSGAFVAFTPQDMSCLHTVQAPIDGKTYELVTRLDGLPLEVYKVGNMLYTIYPENKFILAEKDTLAQVFPILLRFDYQGLEKHYKIQRVGNERVVNRLTDIVDIEPRDQWRFRFKVWLDAETGVLVRGQVFDRSELIFQITFSDIQIGIKPEEINDLKNYIETLLQNGYRIQELDTAQSDDALLLEKGPWSSREPVPGFKPIYYAQKPLTGTTNKLDQWVFTDGVVSISVFIEYLEQPEAQTGNSIQSIDGITRSLSLFKNQYRVTLVGEVPQQTLQEFAKQLELKPR